MKKLINWHKRLIEDIQKRFGISNYVMFNLAGFQGFIGGVIVGIMIGFVIA